MIAQQIVPLVTIGVLLVGLALVTKRVVRVRGSFAAANESDGSETSTPFRPFDSSNDVYRAWSAMVRGLDDEKAHTRTAVEWAKIARNEGLDSNVVEDVTQSFRAVRYGRKRLSSERRNRLRREAERFESESEPNQ